MFGPHEPNDRDKRDTTSSDQQEPVSRQPPNDPLCRLDDGSHPMNAVHDAFALEVSRHSARTEDPGKYSLQAVHTPDGLVAGLFEILVRSLRALREHRLRDLQHLV